MHLLTGAVEIAEALNHTVAALVATQVILDHQPVLDHLVPGHLVPDHQALVEEVVVAVVVEAVEDEIKTRISKPY